MFIRGPVGKRQTPPYRGRRDTAHTCVRDRNDRFVRSEIDSFDRPDAFASIIYWEGRGWGEQGRDEITSGVDGRTCLSQAAVIDFFFHGPTPHDGYYNACAEVRPTGDLFSAIISPIRRPGSEKLLRSAQPAIFPKNSDGLRTKDRGAASEFIMSVRWSEKLLVPTLPNFREIFLGFLRIVSMYPGWESPRRGLQRFSLVLRNPFHPSWDSLALRVRFEPFERNAKTTMSLNACKQNDFEQKTTRTPFVSRAANGLAGSMTSIRAFPRENLKSKLKIRGVFITLFYILSLVSVIVSLVFSSSVNARYCVSKLTRFILKYVDKYIGISLRKYVFPFPMNIFYKRF